MRKLSLLALIILVFGLIACSSPAAPEETTLAETTPSESGMKVETPAEETVKPTEPVETASSDATGFFEGLFGGKTTTDPIVKITELDFRMIPDEKRDPEGILWGRMIFKNNSDYVVRHLQVDYVSDTEFPPSFSTYFSVLPGQTSNMMVTMIGNEVTIKTAKYIILDKDGKNYEVTYDFAKDSYLQKNDPYTDMDRTDKDQVVALADNFKFEYVTSPPDGLGMVYSDITWTNGSDKTINEMYITMYSPDTAYTYQFGVYDPVGPGEVTEPISGFGADKLEPLKLTYLVTHEGTKYVITYDYRIDLYQQIVDPTP